MSTAQSRPGNARRRTSRHYAEAIGKHTFLLLERSVQQGGAGVQLHKLHLILRRVDALRTSVSLVLALGAGEGDAAPSPHDLSEHAAAVLHSMRLHFDCQQVIL